MAKNPNETLVVDTTSQVWVAPVGEPFPAEPDEALAGNWVSLGYMEDAPTPNREIENNELTPWNALEPIRIKRIGDEYMIDLSLIQLNNDTLALVFNDPVITATVGGAVKIVPQAGDTERAVIMDLNDGTYVWRLCIARMRVLEVTEEEPGKGEFVKYTVTVKRLAPAAGDTEFILTNVPGVTAA